MVIYSITPCSSVISDTNCLFSSLFFPVIIERKESKGSILNSEEINTQSALVGVAGTVSSSPPLQRQIPAPISNSRTTVHEENEKTGETNDVSDKSK